MIASRYRLPAVLPALFAVSLYQLPFQSAGSPTPTPPGAIDEKLFNGMSWRQIGAVIVDPRNENVVLVAALGHALGPNQERGIFRTADGGKTWTKVLSKDENTGGIDIVFDPHNPNIVFALITQANLPALIITEKKSV